MTPDATYNADKFATLMLYVAHRCRDADLFGAVKLAKILYYCDFEAIRRFRRPITGATYVKQSEGPLAKEFYDTRRELVDQQRARVVRTPVGDYHEDRLIPVSEEVTLGDAFNSEAKALINETIARFRDMSGTELTQHSHGEFGWIHANENATIPYSTALIARPDDPLIAEWLANRSAA